MSVSGVSGLFGPDGRTVPPGEDLRTIASIEELRLWEPLQLKRIGKLRDSVTVLILALLLAAAQGFFSQRPDLMVAYLGTAVAPRTLMFSGGATVLLGLVLFVTLQIAARRLRPDEEVVAVSRLYMPFDVLPLPDGVMVVNALGGSEPRSLQARTLRDPQSVSHAAGELAMELEKLDAVEPADRRHEIDGRTYFGIDGLILTLMESMEENLASFEDFDLSVPALDARVELSRWLWQHRHEFGQPAGPVARGLSHAELEPLRQQLDRMCAKADAGLEALMTSRNALAAFSENVLQRLEEAHAKSLELIRFSCGLCERTTSWSASNYYAFEDEDQALVETDPGSIAFGRMVYEPERDTWTCPEQSRDVEVSRAMVINRFRDELFYPILDQFRASYHEEIMRIDRDLEDRISQMAHDWRVKAQDLEAASFRSVGDKKTELRKLASQAQALKSKVDGLSRTLEEFRRISVQNRETFMARSLELSRQAEEQAQAICQQYDEQFAARREEAYAQQAEIAEQNRIEEEKRNREVVAAIEKMGEEVGKKVEAAAEEQARIGMMTDADKEDMGKKDTVAEWAKEKAGFKTDKDKVRDKADRAAKAARS